MDIHATQARPSGRRTPRVGFTLIELLIVVAIIAILAAIAVPNFLEAQIRAKVSRALSDMRTIGLGLESYAVDHRYYPNARDFKADKNIDVQLSRRTSRLTTPIAYLTTLPHEIFPPTIGWNGKMGDADLQLPSFDTYDFFDNKSDRDEDGHATDSVRGCHWRLASVGPDLWASFGIVWADLPTGDRQGVDYDATNGTTSNGDIVYLGTKIRNWDEARALAGP